MCSQGVTAAAFLRRVSMCSSDKGALLQPMQPQEFPAVYTIMQQSFPRDEIRPEEGQRGLFAHPEYRMLVARDALGAVQGLMALWLFESAVFMEHFAVCPACRGCGLGSRMLAELLNTAQKPVCLEVELPKDEISRRRIAFYGRHGFCLNTYEYVQPPMARGLSPVPLRIMSQGSPLTPAQYEALRHTLYRVVYPLSAQM